MTTEHLERSPSAHEFNLLEQPWIHVLDLEGREREVSLREALLSAHEYRDIVGDLPTMRFALLRLLLAIAYRALDRVPARVPAEAWGELWKQPALPEEPFERYFAEWRDRFDLIDVEQPFLQSPGLRTAKDEWKPISLIVADTDPERALFTMRSELDSLSFEEAARWLVHTHAYDYSGIKSGAVGDPRVKGGKGYPMGIGWAGWLGGLALVGENLRETLLLNLIRNRTVKRRGDVPIWERPVLAPAPRSGEEVGAIGPLSLMTWPQRRIRLRFEDRRATGVLVTNGDELDYTIRSKDEPMSSWRFSEPQSAKAKALRFMPRKLEPGRSLWRGLSTLIPTSENSKPSDAAKKKWNLSRSSEPAEVIQWLGTLVEEEELPADRIVEVSAVSMEYGTQNASYAEVVSDRLAFAAALADLNTNQDLLGLAENAVSRAEGAARALGRLAADIERAAGGEGAGAHERASSDAYTALDQMFREWLVRVVPGCDRSALLVEWTELVRRSMRIRAERIVEAAPDAAWIGRPADSGGQLLSVATAMQWFEGALFRALGAPPNAPGSVDGPKSDEEHSMTETEALQ